MINFLWIYWSQLEIVNDDNRHQEALKSADL